MQFNKYYMMRFETIMTMSKLNSTSSRSVSLIITTKVKVWQACRQLHVIKSFQLEIIKEVITVGQKT